VKFRRLTWRAYRIPFARTFVTSAGTHKMREGLIVRLEGKDGLYGLGEIAPLRGGAINAVVHSLGTLEHGAAAITADDIRKITKSLGAQGEIAAAIRCGLDTAACDLQAKMRRVRVADVLGAIETIRPRVPVNATIAAAAPELAAQFARHAVESGFRCVKVKVGMMGGVGAESDLVGAVRAAVGNGVAIRLDANQAWGVETAIAAIRSFEPFEIEFVEQPVAAGNIEGLATVRKAVNVPIAADEAVTSLHQARALIQAHAADVLVIKPMVVGGLRPAMEIVQSAAGAGIDAVVTTTIDSGVGIAAALHLAAAAGANRACGLATAELLESDLTSRTPQARSGVMICPEGPGLGVEIDEAKAAPYLERA
jgi:L-Ala-D/L-Glu epimerase